MNIKEVGEIKRRCRRDRSNMTAVYGCYVRENGDIISEFRYPIGTMPENEADKYMALFKKTLSGSIGKTLINIAFATKQVAENEEHYALLSDLRRVALDDDAKRKAFYKNVIAACHLESDYLILLGCDSYDVPFKTKNDETMAEAGDECFTYIQCAVCPVKETKPNLHYVFDEAAFKDGGMIHAVNNPAVGFMFPAFDNRSTNIYGALFYNKDTSNNREELAEAIFGRKTPMAADEEKSSFNALLSSTLGEECSMAVVQTLHDQAALRVQMHKEAKETEPLVIDRNGVEPLLAEGGVSCEKINDAGDAFDEAFGMNAEVRLENIVDVKHFTVQTPDVTVKISPDRAGNIELRTIGGINYIMIPADEGVEVNGVQLHVSSGE